MSTTFNKNITTKLNCLVATASANFIEYSIFFIIILSCSKILQDGNYSVDVLDYTYRTCMNIHFKEDNLWVFVTQRVECWSYSDTRLAAGERRESMAEIYYSHAQDFVILASL